MNKNKRVRKPKQKIDENWRCPENSTVVPEKQSTAPEKALVVFEEPRIMDLQSNEYKELAAHMKRNPYDILLFNYAAYFGLSTLPVRIFKFDPTVPMGLWLGSVFTTILEESLLSVYSFFDNRSLSMYLHFLNQRREYDIYMEKYPVRIHNQTVILNGLPLIRSYKKHFSVEFVMSNHAVAFQTFLEQTRLL